MTTMTLSSMCLILAAASALGVVDGEISFEHLRRNVPGFLPRHTVDQVIRAVENEFYEKHVPTAKEVPARLKKTRELHDRSTYASGDDGPTCEELVFKGTLDYFLGKQYAIQMDDSHGREESGLMRGNYFWLGNYYECNAATDGENIRGGMCVAIFGDNPNSTLGLCLGVCMPDICTGSDVEALLQPDLENGSYVTAICPRKDSEFSAVDITAIVIFTLLAGLVVTGTVAELFKPEGNAEQGVSTRLLLAFSVIKNTRILFDTTRKEGNISVLDGLRFFSMGWVILGHTFSFCLGSIDNLSDVGDYYITHGSSLAIANGTLSVDSFFFLSGFLVAYLGLRQMMKSGGKINVPMMYLHRYLRLTPTVALVMLFTVSLFFQIGQGPFFNLRSDYLLPPCQKYWWANLLYINNLYPEDPNNQCIGWVWYLANDMQFYLLSPIFLVLLYRYPKVGLATLGFLILASAAITGALATYYETVTDVLLYGAFFRLLLFVFSPIRSDRISPAMDGIVPPLATTPPPETTNSKSAYFEDLYTKPWCRIGVYLIGMIAGYILYATNRKIKMSKAFAALMWLVVAAIELTVVYGMWGNIRDLEFPTQSMMSFYTATIRSVWGLGLMWVTIACACGYGGFINTFLSWKVFIPLSRLTFCAYMIHPVIMQYVFNSRELELHLKMNTFIYYYFANMVLAYSAAYLLSMLIEAPVGELQKIIFPSRGRRKEVKHENDSATHAQENGSKAAGNVAVSDEKVGIDNEIELEEDRVAAAEKSEYL